MTVLGLLVAGALGAVVRHEVTERLGRRRSTWPWGTVVVNVVGAAALGVLAAGTLAGWVPDEWLTVVGTGFCGAFTTFSTWIVDSLELAGGPGGRGLAAGSANLVGQLAVGALVATVVLGVL